MLKIVEQLNEHDSDKIRFFLSKADTAGTESDRQRVLMQITQELCKRPGLNKCGFDMPTIYIPSLTDRVSVVFPSLHCYRILLDTTYDHMMFTVGLKS